MITDWLTNPTPIIVALTILLGFFLLWIAYNVIVCVIWYFTQYGALIRCRTSSFK
jgi:hypothetical protein